jgi:hypothetical protein
MKPFSQVMARKQLIGHGHIRTVASSRLGFRGQATGDHSTTGRKVDSGAILGFHNHEVVPREAKGLRRAKPAKPQKEIGEAGKGKPMTIGRAGALKIRAFQFMIKSANMTIKKSNRWVRLVTNTSAHAGGIQSVT